MCRCRCCPRASNARCRRAASGNDAALAENDEDGEGLRGDVCLVPRRMTWARGRVRGKSITNSRQGLCCWPWQHRIRKGGIFTRRYDCGLFLFLRVNCYCVSLLIADCRSVLYSDVVSPTLHAPNNAALPWAPWTIATLLGTSDGPLPGSA